MLLPGPGSQLSKRSPPANSHGLSLEFDQGVRSGLEPSLTCFEYWRFSVESLRIACLFRCRLKEWNRR